MKSGKKKRKKSVDRKGGVGHVAPYCVDSEQLVKPDASSTPPAHPPPNLSATLLLLSHSFSHPFGGLMLPVGSGST